MSGAFVPNEWKKIAFVLVSAKKHFEIQLAEDGGG